MPVQICKTCKKSSEKYPKLTWNKDVCSECFNKPKEKHYFDIKVEVLLPAILTYRVLAEDAEQAASMIKNISPVAVNYKLAGRKEIKLTVYNAGTCIIKFIKNLLGR